MSKQVRAFWALILAQLAVLVGAGPALAGNDITSTSQAMTLSPDGIPWESPAGCFLPRKPTGGGVKLSTPAEDFILGSFPRLIDGAWWNGVASRPDDLTTSSTMTVFARCVKRSENVIYRTKTESNGGAVASAFAKCPRGTKLVGGGVDLGRGVQPRAGGFVDNSYPTGSFPSGRRGWTAVGFRPEGDVEVTSHAACLRSGRKVVRRYTEALMLPYGEVYTAKATCPRGTDLSGGGVRLTSSANDRIKGSFPQGERTWVAKAVNLRDPGRVSVYALCLK